VIPGIPRRGSIHAPSVSGVTVGFTSSQQHAPESPPETIPLMRYGCDGNKPTYVGSPGRRAIYQRFADGRQVLQVVLSRLIRGVHLRPAATCPDVACPYRLPRRLRGHFLGPGLSSCTGFKVAGRGFDR